MAPNRRLRRRAWLGGIGVGVAGVGAGLVYNAAPMFWRQYARELGEPIAPPPRVPDPARWPDTGLHAAWLGHSTVLLKIDGFTLITDPVLSRASDWAWAPLPSASNAWSYRRCTWSSFLNSTSSCFLTPTSITSTCPRFAPSKTSPLQSSLPAIPRTCSASSATRVSRKSAGARRPASVPSPFVDSKSTTGAPACAPTPGAATTATSSHPAAAVSCSPATPPSPIPSTKPPEPISPSCPSAPTILGFAPLQPRTSLAHGQRRPRRSPAPAPPPDVPPQHGTAARTPRPPILRRKERERPNRPPLHRRRVSPHIGIHFNLHQ